MVPDKRTTTATHMCFVIDYCFLCAAAADLDASKTPSREGRKWNGLTDNARTVVVRCGEETNSMNVVIRSGEFFSLSFKSSSGATFASLYITRLCIVLENGVAESEVRDRKRERKTRGERKYYICLYNETVIAVYDSYRRVHYNVYIFVVHRHAERNIYIYIE